MGNVPDRQARNFLSLLGSVVGLSPEPPEPPFEWERIYRLAAAHNVSALVLEAAAEIPGFSSAPGYRPWLLAATRQVAEQTGRTQAFLELYRAFSAAGLHPVVMKGIVCRELYGPHREHRPSGDEDILIRKPDFAAAERVLLAQGYRTELEGVTARQLDQLQEVTFSHAWNGLRIETHVNPFGYETPWRAGMNRYFRDVFDTTERIVIDGTELCAMSHTNHFLFLVLHAFRHLMSGGFGVRQVLDILLYQRVYSSAIDWGYANRVLNKAGAEEFLSDMVWIGNRYMGFEFLPTRAARCPEELLEDLLANGAFGMATQAQGVAASMVLVTVKCGKGGSEAKTLTETIFPGKAFFAGRYPEIIERPWLLPVCWVKRWLRFLRHSRQHSNLAKDGIAISRRRIELLKKYDIL